MCDCQYTYYSRAILWDKDYSKNLSQKQRFEETAKMIPADTQSILDVGCGSGFFVNSLICMLPKRFTRVVGLDLSPEALKHVRIEKIRGTITELPFDDESFDLVTCFEVLEHLRQPDFEKGISELQRVSKKYILVSVPNEERLLKLLVMCPKCYCCFNPSFHVRSFDKRRLVNLFDKFQLIECKEIGPIRENVSYSFLLRAAYIFHLKPALPRTAICPQCSYTCGTEKLNKKNNLSNTSSAVSLLRFIASLVSLQKRSRPWLAGLFWKTGQT